MGFKRLLAFLAFSFAWLAAVPTPLVAQQEQLVVTKLPDPDPNFVPPPPEPQQKHVALSNREDPTLEEAMQDFGRAIGQATMAERERLEAHCKQAVPNDATEEQRFALEAACRYQRH